MRPKNRTQLITNSCNHAPEECAEAAIETLETQISILLPGKPTFVRLVLVGKSLDQECTLGVRNLHR